jgi:hypothetical protein
MSTAFLFLFTIFAGSDISIAPASAEVALTPPSSSVEDALRRQKINQEEKTNRIVALTKPLIDCVKRKAHSEDIYTSAEGADVAARAAVGLCSKEEGAYRSAVFKLAIVMTSFDASARVQQTHEQLVDLALAVIVGERQRGAATPKTSAPSATANSATLPQLFKQGCNDFVAGRSTQNAFSCVSIVATTMEMVAMLESGAKEKNVCIPHDQGLLTGDYVKLINRHPELIDDNGLISVGIMLILGNEFPCHRR